MNDSLFYYLLGFIYADGCYHKKNNVISIRLSIKDYDFLEEISKIFNVNIKKYNSRIKDKLYQSCLINICGNNIIRFIENGIVERKTYINDDSIFNNIPYEYKWDFIRGFFDGDGSVFTMKNSSGNLKYNIGFVGLNEKLLNSIRLFINTELNLKANLRIDGKYYRLIYNGNRQCVAIRTKLYYNEDLFCLKRKKDKLFLTTCTESPKYIYFDKTNNRYIVSMTKIFHDLELAEKFVNIIRNLKESEYEEFISKVVK